MAEDEMLEDTVAGEGVPSPALPKPRLGHIRIPLSTARVRAIKTRAEGAPLRVRLVAITVLLTLVGLVAAGAAAVTSLHGYLLQRVDAQLMQSVDFIERGGNPAFTSGGTARPGGPPSQFYVRYADQNGAQLGVSSNPDSTDTAVPRIPAVHSTAFAAGSHKYITVGSTGGSASWRVLEVPATYTLTDGSAVSGSLAIAIRLDDVDHTVNHLVKLEAIIGLIVLLLMAAGSYYAVRSSLRPLAEVEATAELIAAGDMSQRVKEQDPRTEVGRLAGAFNTMLGRIQTAFQEQQESEEAARTSEARMRRFIADASHELRTPLTSIRGFAELHRQGAIPAGEPVEQAMSRIESEATRMGLLVEDLLLLARLDQQRPLEEKPVDMAKVVSDVVAAAKPTIGRRKLSLDIADGDDLPVVLGDEHRLHQVVSNLVSNALTHTTGAVELHLSVDQRRDRKGVIVEVSDHGPGLAPEEAERVFERFYRADTSRTRANGGSGLGLSIVSALVAAHDGGVELESAPGEGATFRVILPLYTPQ